MEPRFFRATRLVLGALLLITGILKAVQVFNGSPSDADIVFSQWLPFGIVAELALGVWLVLAGGVFPVLTWLLATAFFACWVLYLRRVYSWGSRARASAF